MSRSSIRSLSVLVGLLGANLSGCDAHKGATIEIVDQRLDGDKRSLIEAKVVAFEGLGGAVAARICIQAVWFPRGTNLLFVPLANDYTSKLYADTRCVDGLGDGDEWTVHFVSDKATLDDATGLPFRLQIVFAGERIAEDGVAN